MKAIASGVLFASLAIFFASCECSTKHWECKGYDSPELNGWFPYANSNLLIFQNSGGQRDTIHLNNFETSAPYTGSGSSRSCEAHRYLESVERMSSGDLKMSVRLTKSDNSGNIYQNAFITLHRYNPVEFQNVTAGSLGTAKYNFSTPMTVQYLSTVTLAAARSMRLQLC